MISRKVQQYKMLMRVAEFGAKHMNVFPITSVAGEILAALVVAVAKLAAHATAQVGASAVIRRGSIVRREVRQTLFSKLELIHWTARALNINEFWKPKRPTEQSLLNAARHFVKATDAETKAKFIQHGMADDFLATLDSLIQQLEKAGLSRADGKALTSRAIQEYDVMLAEALALLDRFEAVIENSLAGNTGVLAEWYSIRRVEKVPQFKDEPEKKPDASTSTAVTTVITTPGGESAPATAG